MNSNGMDIISLIFLGIAVLIFLYLRSILGRRTGNERTPYDPYSQNNNEPKRGQSSTSDNDNVVPMPGRRPSSEIPGSQNQVKDMVAEVRKFADDGTPLSTGLLSLVNADDDFDPESFMKGAERAYEMIIIAYSEGDKRTLKRLLSKDVYNRFTESIERREKAGESLSTSFIGFEKVTMLEAGVDNKQAEVTVKFKSSLMRALRDASGTLIEGDETTIEKTTDIWTFGRPIMGRDPNWKLIATESES